MNEGKDKSRARHTCVQVGYLVKRNGWGSTEGCTCAIFGGMELEELTIGLWDATNLKLYRWNCVGECGQDVDWKICRICGKYAEYGPENR